MAGSRAGIKFACTHLLQVKDWDFLGDEKVGHAALPVSRLRPGETRDIWVELDLEADKVIRPPAASI